jgi:methionyl-tRNA synthetase
VVEIHLSPQNLEFAKALEAIWSLVQVGNQYIDKTAPWVLAKKPENRPRLNTVLYNAAEALRFVGLSLYPFMPQAAEELKKQLGAMLNFSKPLLSGEVSWGGLLPGTTVTKGNSLFPRVDPDKSKGGEPVSDQIPAGQPSSPAGPGASPAPEQITIEDFQKVQLQVAKIVSAERVPKSEKLLKLQVDLGGEQRQIVAGIGKRYEPEALIGRRVVVVSNLKPAKLMGVESQGMVLAAGDKDVIGLVSLEGDPEPGTKVK